MKNKLHEMFSLASNDCGMDVMLGWLDTTVRGLARMAHQICFAAFRDDSLGSNSRHAEVACLLCSTGNSSLSLAPEVSPWWHAHRTRFSGSWTVLSSETKRVSRPAVRVIATKKEK